MLIVTGFINPSDTARHLPLVRGGRAC